MEIINGYIESMSLGTTVYNNITPETSSYNISSNNIYFFNGSYDTEVLYNVINEATLLSTYASQYLGKLTNVSLDFLYTDSKKQRVIKQPSPNALRFKDERYFRTNYVMGNSFTKPTESDKFKIKINGSTVSDGFTVNGITVNSNVVDNSSTPFKSNVNYGTPILQTGIDAFDTLFLGGTPVDGGEIDFTNNAIYGYRVDGSGPRGYKSISMQEVLNMGYGKIVINNNSSNNGAGFFGYDWNNALLDNYNYSTANATYTIDLVNKTASVTASYNRVASTINISNADFYKLVMGVYAIQSGSGWQYWDVKLYKMPLVYDVEMVVESTTNLIIGNPNNPVYNSIEVVPLDANDQPIQRTIDWCAIKIKNDANGDYFIYIDEIGTRDNKSYINLYKKESVYGTENIVNSIKIDLRNKSVGEV